MSKNETVTIEKSNVVKVTSRKISSVVKLKLVSEERSTFFGLFKPKTRTYVQTLDLGFSHKEYSNFSDFFRMNFSSDSSFLKNDTIYRKAYIRVDFNNGSYVVKYFEDDNDMLMLHKKIINKLNDIKDTDKFIEF